MLGARELEAKPVQEFALDPRVKATLDTLGRMRRTKIVATIGPASREPETLLRMIEAGMDVARLNYSHGTLDEHAETVRRVRDAAGRVGRPVAILQDLPGPKLRIGPLREDIVELKPGEHLTFSVDGEEVPGDAKRMSVSWEGMADALEKDAVLYLADGSVRLRVVDVRKASKEVLPMQSRMFRGNSLMTSVPCSVPAKPSRRRRCSGARRAPHRRA